MRLYHVKLGAAPDNTASLQRRLSSASKVTAGLDVDIASAQMDGDVTVEKRQAFACFIEDLFLRCCNPTGQLRNVVQKVLRKQLNCTLATWVKFSTHESDAVYERAVCILREITAFREGNVRDLDSQLRDSADGPQRDQCRAILDSILDPKWTTDEESLDEVVMIDQERLYCPYHEARRVKLEAVKQAVPATILPRLRPRGTARMQTGSKQHAVYTLSPRAHHNARPHRIPSSASASAAAIEDSVHPIPGEIIVSSDDDLPMTNSQLNRGTSQNGSSDEDVAIPTKLAAPRKQRAHRPPSIPAPVVSIGIGPGFTFEATSEGQAKDTLKSLFNHGTGHSSVTINSRDGTYFQLKCKFCQITCNATMQRTGMWQVSKACSMLVSLPCTGTFSCSIASTTSQPRKIHSKVTGGACKTKEPLEEQAQCTCDRCRDEIVEAVSCFKNHSFCHGCFEDLVKGECCVYEHVVYTHPTYTHASTFYF